MTPPLRSPTIPLNPAHVEEASAPADPSSSAGTGQVLPNPADRFDRHFRNRLLSDAFQESVNQGRSSSWSSPWALSPFGLLGALQGCNHPPLGSTGETHGEDGGSDGGTIDAGMGGSSDGGSDGGISSEPCRVEYPLAVLFYDCVDVGASSATSSRICFSDRFGGDVSAAQDWVRRALENARRMYVEACSPVAISPTHFFPDRVMNGVVDSPESEFIPSGDYYTLRPDLTRFTVDISAAGEDPERFGSYLVLNGWSASVLPSATRVTYNFSHRAQAPYALIHGHLDESIPIGIPASVRVFLRHEMMHAFNSSAWHNGFTRLFHAHEEPEVCPHEWDARWLCLLENGSDGSHLSATDWQQIAGSLGTTAACDDEAWVSRCQESSALICGDVSCPSLPRYNPICNDQGYCEYHPASIDQPWRNYDEWIYVPPGSSFLMGSVESPDNPSSEWPAQGVTFAQGYFIGKYEIPVEAYEQCLAEGACLPPNLSGWDGAGWGLNTSAARPFHPANHIDWAGALGLCEFIRPGARHPNRAEWEFAARGPTSTMYPFGDTLPSCSSENAVFNETGDLAGYGCSTGGTAPVFSSPSGVSPIGALNMAGNVWEWTEECWREDHFGAPTNGLPSWDCSDEYSMDVRGGGFNDSASNLRAARRIPLNHAIGNANVGIRCSLQHYWGP